MLSHGLATGSLFLLVGFIYERRHTREITEFGGIARVMPLYATAFMIATLASVGLPGLSGFVGEFLVLVGSFKSLSLSWAVGFTVIAATGVILGALYMLWMYQRVFLGDCVKSENKGLLDLSLREVLVVLPLFFFILWMGVQPSPWLKKMEPDLRAVIEYQKDQLARQDDGGNVKWAELEAVGPEAVSRQEVRQ